MYLKTAGFNGTAVSLLHCSYSTIIDYAYHSMIVMFSLCRADSLRCTALGEFNHSYRYYAVAVYIL